MPFEIARNAFSGKFGAAAADSGMLTGPFVKIPMAISLNTHPFYKTPIYDEQDPAWRQGAKIFEFVYNQFAPGFGTTEPGNFIYKLMQAYEGNVNAYGTLPPTVGQGWARAAGWNVYAPNRPRNLYFMKRAIDDYQAKTESLIRQNPEDADKILRRRNRNLMRMIEDFEQYTKDSEATIPEEQ
jgi:hypothetical protein